ncbi:MAG: acyltransferase [Gammaproteobacteria bacterium]|nr:acyltransferase [Gammaproteobacteria bacterium]
MDSNITKKSSTRSDGIDYLRGWLIVFVIVGHIVLGSIHSNWIRYSIYAFHMPLFIGLTGYLINPETLRGSSWLDLARNYWWRMLFPFAFAYAFFTGVLVWHAFEEQRITVGLLISYIHTPYYHLWFIPTMLLWVLAYRVTLKVRLPLMLAMLIAMAVSLYWASVPKTDQHAILGMLTSKKVFYFFSFFLFGAWLRSESSIAFRAAIERAKFPLVLVSLTLAGVYLSQIGNSANILKGPAWWGFNCLLIAIAIPWSKKLTLNTNWVNSTIVSMGRISLPIYLWHVLPLFVLKGLDVHQSHVTTYYSVSILTSLAITALLIKWENKATWSNMSIYGSK